MFKFQSNNTRTHFITHEFLTAMPILGRGDEGDQGEAGMCTKLHL
jgi:hypothetical protein